MSQLLRPTLSRDQQTDICRVLVKVAQLLAQAGAESRIIEQLSVRLGLALGVESIEMSISSSAIVLTTLYQNRCVSTTRRVRALGINMHVVCELQRICLQAEQKALNLEQVRKEVSEIKPFHYNRWLVVVMIGLACASFSLLFGGDWPVFIVTFIATASAMAVRQQLHHHQYNVLLISAATAFVATLVASYATIFKLGQQPYLAMAASVLLLVPGFPLINAVSDLVKGYFNMGLARWGIATLITISAAVGIILAMNLTGIWGWEL